MHGTCVPTDDEALNTDLHELGPLSPCFLLMVIITCHTPVCQYGIIKKMRLRQKSKNVSQYINQSTRSYGIPIKHFKNSVRLLFASCNIVCGLFFTVTTIANGNGYGKNRSERPNTRAFLQNVAKEILPILRFNFSLDCTMHCLMIVQ